ncbi:MAG: hypothetical protein IJR22_06070 [Acidaminococcaceae bacterium]|nr:hypothetical protein [Acidaminococcaceae bacterium]
MNISKKKIANAVMVLVLTAGFSSCEARIPLEDMVIGGVGVGTHINYVKQVYGEPSAVKQHKAEVDSDIRNPMEYSYGKTFTLYADGSIVYSVSSTGNNGLKTSKGITVGMPYSNVVKAYGKPDYAQSWKGFTNYTYLATTRLTRFYFKIDDSTQKIVAIGIG